MAECERCKTLEAALQDERRLLQRKLGEVEHHETRSHAGQWENAFAAAHLPDWEIRQRLEAIDAALAAQPAEPLIVGVVVPEEAFRASTVEELRNPPRLCLCGIDSRICSAHPRPAQEGR